MLGGDIDALARVSCAGRGLVRRRGQRLQRQFRDDPGAQSCAPSLTPWQPCRLPPGRSECWLPPAHTTRRSARPFRSRNQLQLLGAGAASTKILNTAPPTLGQYEGQGGLVNCRVVWEAGGPNIAPGTVLAGFRITSTRGPFAVPAPPEGVWVEAYYGTCEVELRDLELDSMFCGVRVEASSEFARVNASRIKVSSNIYGLIVSDSAQCFGREVEVVDSISDGSEHPGEPSAPPSFRSRARGSKAPSTTACMRRRRPVPSATTAT